MSRLTEREIARRLAEPLDEEPPAGLLEKIKSEIPPVVPVGIPEGTVRPFPQPAAEPRRQRWLIAATLATAVLGGIVAWQVLWIRPKLAATEEVPVPEAVEMQTQDAGVPEGALPMPPPPPPPPAAAAPPPMGEADASRVTELKKELQELGYSSGSRNEELRLRRQSQPVQPMEIPQAAPEPAYDFEGGVEGGVVGGVPGGVVGGTVGGVVGGASAAEEPPLRVGASGYAKPASPKVKAGTTGSTGGNAEPNDEAYGDTFFRSAGTNPFVDTEEDRLSTFGLDVDTASYTVARRYLEDGNLPDPDSVRVEEFVNFFDYGDPAPTRDDFALKAEGAPTPFAGPGYRLLRFNVKARQIRPEDRKPAMLIFVVDVSGSMDMENRLGLVKRSLEMLLGRLRPSDKVGLVVYGSEARVVLEPTHDLDRVRQAVAGLRTDGATNAEAGITLGYDLANRYFRPEWNNRLLLCSDGVANVGNTGPDRILERIGREARRGIELTTLGFGMGNYNDVLMEQLADKGDGRYAYLDTVDEARRVLVEELEGTLETIAKDAKVQVAFNPEVVDRWRLLGYENRDIADEKFRDDSVDAGEIGAGHSVTALYEIRLKPGATADRPVANLHLRWRSEKTGRVREEEKLLRVSQLAGSWESATPALRLASVVAELAEILRGSYWARGSSLDDLYRLTQRVAGEQEESRRSSDVNGLSGLIAKAARLQKR